MLILGRNDYDIYVYIIKKVYNCYDNKFTIISIL